MEFRTVKRRFFPLNQYPEIPECCIKEPILYFEDNSGEIIDADFVKEIPLRASGELTNKGLELYVPFYAFEHSNNPCIGEHITTGRELNVATDVTIMKDGVNLFPLPRFNSFEWRDNNDSHLKPFYQQLFAHYVLCYSFLRRMTVSIYNERLSLSLFSFYLDQPWKSFYLQQIEKLTDYLKGIRIKKITEDLSISISESFYRKIGHDDEYSIIKTSNVGDNSTLKDIFSFDKTL